MGEYTLASRKRNFLIPFTIFCFFTILVSSATWMEHITFDDAFNFQVALSLADKFVYSSTYIPQHIYNPDITTNGPLQYFMAMCIKMGGIDVGRAVGLGLVGGLCATVVYCFSRKAFVVYILMFLFWPLFVAINCLFLGEVFEISMILIGLIVWGKWCRECVDYSGGNYPHRILWGNKYLWLSSIAFGFAISTKLLAISVVSVFLFLCTMVVIWDKNTDYVVNRWGQISLLFILPLSFSIVIFIAQFSVSILHSTGQVQTIFPHLWQFVIGHFKQGIHATRVYTISQELNLFQKNLCGILALAVSLVVLLKKHHIFIVLVICFLIFFFLLHFDIRRLSPLIIVSIFIAAKTFDSQKIIKSQSGFEGFDFACTLQIGLFVSLILGGIMASNYKPSFLFSKLASFSLQGVPPNYAFVTRSQSFYDNSLLGIIRNLDGPIFFTGWWQFPEISLRSGVHFYDRFAEENHNIFQEDRPNYLLFNSAFEPKIENSMCGIILYKDHNLVLCEHKF